MKPMFYLKYFVDYFHATDTFTLNFSSIVKYPRPRLVCLGWLV